MVHVRIILYILAGWLFASGHINDEIRQLMTTDPDVAALVQAGIAAVTAGVSWLWWQLAKRFGWST